jgi:hypothetical protein
MRDRLEARALRCVPNPGGDWSTKCEPFLGELQLRECREVVGGGQVRHRYIKADHEPDQHQAAQRADHAAAALAEVGRDAAGLESTGPGESTIRRGGGRVQGHGIARERLGDVGPFN